MSSPRERLLTETIKNLLIGIHNSEEIYKEYSKIEKKVARMSQKEIDNVAATVASNVEQYVVAFEKRTKKKPRTLDIKKKIKRELENT